MNIPKPNGNGSDVALDVKDLRVHYLTPEGEVIAVNGVTFQLHRG